MALFIKNFRRVFRRGNFHNYGKNKGKYEPRRRSNKLCFGCKKLGHFIADCLEEKKKNKDDKEGSSKRERPRYKKQADEAQLGQEWDSQEESESKNEEVATMAFKASPHHFSLLFEDLTDDEDQDPIIYLMAKNVKVNSPNSSDDELDEEDEVASLISQYGKKGATKIMKLMMKVDELEETLESQEELLRLERETTKTLDKDLAYERKENKRIKDFLKTNDNILLEVRELLTSKKEKVND
jgi:hypothetical protein